MTDEERAALKKAQDERDELAAKVAKLEKKLEKAEAKSDGKPAVEKIDKSALDPTVREALEKAERDAANTRERLEKAEKIAKEERDLRVEREFISKASDEFPHLGDPAELGPRLMRMSETLSKEDYDAHLTQLAAANEQIAKGDLFREIGRGGEPTPGSAGQDFSKLQKAADEIRKADSSLSPYEAMHLAMSQDREAQARYLADVR